MIDNSKPTVDSKYIQQHLANERTYLAWVRTSITIIGVGFLITNLHFSSMSVKIVIGDIMAQTIGLASILIGILSLAMSTIWYFKKGNEINIQQFKYSRFIILFLSVALLLIFLAFGFYYLFAWGII